MSNPWFQFKQFRIEHDRCAMKVGTDGVLLGAWAPLHDGMTILDVGTGSGLIALMLAQRFPSSHILGIDIDKSAVEQAQQNVAASPFVHRVTIQHTAFQDLSEPHETFDAVVCNPPFFEETLLPPDAGRSAARHTTSLSFNELICGAARVLKTGGSFCVILPTQAFESFHLQCFSFGFMLEHRCAVQTSPKRSPKRTMASFRKNIEVSRFDEQLILTEGGQRSKAYQQLTGDFYL